MKARNYIAVFAAFVLCLAAPAFAAAKAKSDKDALQGTWAVREAIYPDKTVEKELDMSFSFKGDTMTNPMDESVLGYAIDEKAKTVKANGKDGSINLTYRVVDDKTVEFSALTVKDAAGKETVIVGQKGMFTLLTLAKK
jgi:hypothetical protein